MSFENFRCMMSSEDSADEGPAYCAYPKCWLEDCPHKQARDRLVKVEKLPEKWRKEVDSWGISKGCSTQMYRCADELEKILGGEMIITQTEKRDEVRCPKCKSLDITQCSEGYHCSDCDTVFSGVEEKVTVQQRLKVAEKIMSELFIEVDCDSEVFKKYCKLCAENDDCEWGDNFPHCFVEVKSVE